MFLPPQVQGQITGHALSNVEGQFSNLPRRYIGLAECKLLENAEETRGQPRRHVW